MASFDVPTVLDTLKTDLEAAVSGLYVRTVPADPEADPNEGVVFEDVVATAEYHQMGATGSNAYRTDWAIEGRIWAIAAETGAEAGTASRDRVFTLFDALVTILEDNTDAIYSSALSMVPATWDYAPFARGDGSWGAQITFTLTGVELV